MASFGGRGGVWEHEFDSWLRQRAGLPAAAPPTELKITRIAEIVRRTGYSRVHIWRMQQDGKFPPMVRLTENAEAQPRRPGPGRPRKKVPAAEAADAA